MPTADQAARLARILAGIRTAKEALPAINHGPNAVAAEQIARVSALLDRMHRSAVMLSMAAGPVSGEQPTTLALPASRQAA